jgi:hypothetical protein
MTEYTAYVTQRIRYRVTGEYETPQDFARAIASGLWDDTDNEVEWDRVEVFDTEGQLLHDTAPEGFPMSENTDLTQRQYVVGLPVMVTINDEGFVTAEVDLSELAVGVEKDYLAGPLGEEWDSRDRTLTAVEDAEVLRRWVQTHSVRNEDFAAPHEVMGS